MVHPIIGQSPTYTLSEGTYKADCYHPLPPSIQERIKDKSYKKGGPIPMNDLAYLQITHFDMKGNICTGELIVYERIAAKIMEIFKDIHAIKFPIKKMQLISNYFNEDCSIEDNNSSAVCATYIYNSGKIPSKPFALGIELNARQNPCVSGGYVMPSSGRKYSSRSLDIPGKIHSDSAIVKIFKERGFRWGGDYEGLQMPYRFYIVGI